MNCEFVNINGELSILSPKGKIKVHFILPANKPNPCFFILYKPFVAFHPDWRKLFFVPCLFIFLTPCFPRSWFLYFFLCLVPFLCLLLACALCLTKGPRLYSKSARLWALIFISSLTDTYHTPLRQMSVDSIITTLSLARIRNWSRNLPKRISAIEVSREQSQMRSYRVQFPRSIFLQ